MKTCRVCLVVKDLECFYKRTYNKDGKDSRCIECSLANPEQRSAYTRGRRVLNLEKRRKREKERTRNRTPEKKAEVAAYKRKYYLENSEKIIKKSVENTKKRRKENPQTKLRYALHGRIRNALNGVDKIGKTQELLGCTFAYFKEHLESKFTEGMSWENHGFYGWHIDHIRPCASFDLTVDENQRLCFHYSNMQPLWATDNLKKSDSWCTSSMSSNPNQQDLNLPVLQDTKQ